MAASPLRMASFATSATAASISAPAKPPRKAKMNGTRSNVQCYPLYRADGSKRTDTELPKRLRIVTTPSSYWRTSCGYASNSEDPGAYGCYHCCGRREFDRRTDCPVRQIFAPE